MKNLERFDYGFAGAFGASFANHKFAQAAVFIGLSLVIAIYRHYKHNSD